MGAGRPEEYSEELAIAICGLIAIGLSLKAICDRPEMPCTATVYNWLYKKTDFLDRYTHAREAQAEVMAQDMIDLADNCNALTNEQVQKVKLQIETRKWIAAKLKPKKYGDAMTFKGDKDNPIEIGLATALEGLGARRLPAPDNARPVIDLSPLPVNAKDYI